ncbi:MAG: immunoglobulin-like domain-containing protein [Candidatus Paceibacterota bacterium]|jgi:hypothetical protein
MNKKILTFLLLLAPVVTLASPTATLDVYTIDNLIISPKDTSGLFATTSSIDLGFSDPVSVNLDILDSLGSQVKHIYNNSSVTNPDPKIWYGKDNGSNFVADGTYTVQVVYSDAGGVATNTSETIIVDNDVPIVGAITITPSYVSGPTTYIATTSSFSVPVDDEGTGVRDCNFGYDNGSVKYWLTTITPTAGYCVFDDVDTSDQTMTRIVAQAYDNALHSQGTELAVVVDVEAPVITLVGDSTVNLEVGTSYTDAGATANDSVEGDLTSQIVSAGTVDTSTVGTYAITYNVTDSLGNIATEVTRTVNVVLTPTSTPPPSSGSHSSGYVLGWGPNGPINPVLGQVLGTSTSRALGASTSKAPGVTRERKLLIIQKRLNFLRRDFLTLRRQQLQKLSKQLQTLQQQLDNLKNPKAEVKAKAKPVATQAVTIEGPAGIGEVITPVDETESTATTTAPVTPTKPWWKFW